MQIPDTNTGRADAGMILGTYIDNGRLTGDARIYWLVVILPPTLKMQ